MINRLLSHFKKGVALLSIIVSLFLTMILTLTLSNCQLEARETSFDSALIDEISGSQIRCKIIDIGVWNMDSTSTVNINHGINITKLISIHVVVFGDLNPTGDIVEPLNLVTLATGHMNGGFSVANDTVIALVRTTGGWFDSVLYDDAIMNRGKIFIQYYD